MELDWPYLDPALSLDTIVAKQAAEKTQIASVKVKILKASQPIDTYAGGSDVSYQRSGAAARPTARRTCEILAIAYARTTEAAFEAQLLAVADRRWSCQRPARPTRCGRSCSRPRRSSRPTRAARRPSTGQPGRVRPPGRAGSLWPAAYGTNNIAGTAQASSLAINISGLPIVRAPFLTGNVHLVTNGDGAAWHEDGPFPISAEDVSKLGQNVAIWGMGTGATTAPKGIVKSTLT
jgi:hypothetical protein